jgi:hypothetical protein
MIAASIYEDPSQPSKLDSSFLIVGFAFRPRGAESLRDHVLGGISADLTESDFQEPASVFANQASQPHTVSEHGVPNSIHRFVCRNRSRHLPLMNGTAPQRCKSGRQHLSFVLPWNALSDGYLIPWSRC